MTDNSPRGCFSVVMVIPMDWLDNVKMGQKLVGSFLLLAILLGIVAVVGYVEMKTINDGMTEMYYDRAVPLATLGEVDADFLYIRGNLYKYLSIPDQRAKTKAEIDEYISIINQNMDAIRATYLIDSEKEELARFDVNWAEFQKVVKDTLAQIDAGNEADAAKTLAGGAMAKSREATGSNIDNLKAINVKKAEELNIQGDETFSAATLTLAIIGIIAVILAISLGYTISRSITTPLQRSVVMMQELGVGHLGMRLSYQRKDEIGDLARAIDQFADNLVNNFIAILKQVSVGDLSAMPVPHDDKDEIAPAVIKMIESLRGLVSEAKTLSQAAIDGKLSVRGDAEKFQGGYREVILGMNETFEGIVVPLNEAMRLAGSYAQGDFTDRVNDTIEMRGDFIRFKEALNQIGIQGGAAISGVKTEVENLSAGMEETNASAEEVASTTSLLAQSSNEVSQLAERSGTGIRQILTAMEDLSNTVSSVAAKAEQASMMAQQTVDLTEKGVSLAGAAEKGMEGISSSVEETSGIITDITGQMEEIGKIVDVITGIAEQTGLLALNAAIEAARAGEAGMGFAVVADEVKSLALESQKSAENIASIIGNLQKKTQQVSLSMKNSSVEVQAGNEAVTRTLAIFDEIVQAINSVHANMTEVAGAAEEQAAAVEEITASVNEVGNLVQRTAKEAVDSAAATEEVTASIDQITRAISDAAASVQRIAENMGMFVT
ncbi:methyl-accepting chemotaxis sensory transducer [Methanospirillum hungatei JF-1]|uniref:Methyl-accepting chemotaxis sensory transducer n=2 Tax=Methanospirillum hungatei TaxID=2203 RepID=Q2FQ61_METHJ|nr:methyl-accepting chemotaxis sensory transducer [Methanospirillum hungatei JF-1]